MPGIESIAFLLFVLVGIPLLVLHFKRSRSLLDQWAAQNGYTLVESDYRNFARGPFFWSSKNQTVYRITVRDPAGNLRHGWLRCGSYFTGLLSNQVEVRWDD